MGHQQSPRALTANVVSLLTAQLLGRQFLISQHHASILANLVGIALILAGPRSWILFKALFFYAIDLYPKHFRPKNTLQSSTHLPLVPVPSLSSAHGRGSKLPQQRQQSHLENDNLNANEESHSELEAAFALVRNVWKLLRSGRIELPSGSIVQVQTWPSTPCIRRIWKHVLQRPFDIVVSVLLSALFIGIFVAESSANVMSANIITDTTALVSSPKCALLSFGHSNFDPAAYRKQYYRAKHRADGCNSFYNQSLTYTERSEHRCPFSEETCALCASPALTLDTGLIDAEFVGINSLKRFQFRRTTTCSPLKADGGFESLKKAIPWKDEFADELSHHLENFTASEPYKTITAASVFIHYFPGL